MGDVQGWQGDYLKVSTILMVAFRIVVREERNYPHFKLYISLSNYGRDMPFITKDVKMGLDCR